MPFLSTIGSRSAQAVVCYTEVPEIQDVVGTKSMAPPYSPNAWAELAQILGGSPLGEYFQGHRGDF